MKHIPFGDPLAGFKTPGVEEFPEATVLKNREYVKNKHHRRKDAPSLPEFSRGATRVGGNFPTTNGTLYDSVERLNARTASIQGVTDIRGWNASAAAIRDAPTFSPADGTVNFSGNLEGLGKNGKNNAIAGRQARAGLGTELGTSEASILRKAPRSKMPLHLKESSNYIYAGTGEGKYKGVLPSVGSTAKYREIDMLRSGLGTELGTNESSILRNAPRSKVRRTASGKDYHKGMEVNLDPEKGHMGVGTLSPKQYATEGDRQAAEGIERMRIRSLNEKAAASKAAASRGATQSAEGAVGNSALKSNWDGLKGVGNVLNDVRDAIGGTRSMGSLFKGEGAIARGAMLGAAALPAGFAAMNAFNAIRDKNYGAALGWSAAGAGAAYATRKLMLGEGAAKLAMKMLK